MAGSSTNPKITLVVQHFGPPYLDFENNPEHRALRDRMESFANEIRAQGGVVIHSPPGDSRSILAEEAKKSPGYKDGDLYAANYDGDGKGPKFLETVMGTKPDQVIMTGPYFDACNRYTSEYLRANGIKVSSPMDLADPPTMRQKPDYDRTAKEMQEKGIDTTRSSREIAQLARQGKLSSSVDVSVESSPQPTPKAQSAGLDPDSLEDALARFESKAVGDGPKPKLNATQLADAGFLLADKYEREVGKENVRSSKILDKDGSVKGYAFEYEKSGIKTKTEIADTGDVKVTKKYAAVGRNDYSVSTISPSGRVSSQYFDKGDSQFYGDDRKASIDRRALETGAKTEAKLTHSSDYLAIGPEDPTRTVSDMGKKIESRADVRIPEWEKGNREGGAVVQGIADTVKANQVADELDTLARHPERLSVEQTQNLTKMMVENNIDPSDLKRGLGEYSARLRGAEGAKLVGEMRGSLQAKEGASLLSGLLDRPVTAEPAKVAAAAVEGPGAGGNGVGDLLSRDAHLGAQGGGAPDVPKSHAKVPNAKGSFTINAAVGVGVAMTMLATGASAAEATEAAVGSVVPYADAAKKAASGDMRAALDSAVPETGAMAGGAAGIAMTAGVGGVAAPLVAGAAVGYVGYKAAEMAWQTPERLREAEKFTQQKDEALAKIPDDYANEWASGYKGEPTNARQLFDRDPEARDHFKSALQSEGRERDMAAFKEYEDTDARYVDAMKKYDVDVSPEKLKSDKQVEKAFEFG